MKMYFISSVLSALCVGIICVIISALYNQYIIRKKLKRFPQVPRCPFIGSRLEVFTISEHERMGRILSRVNEYKEGIFVEWHGLVPSINVFKPEFLEIIFLNTINIQKGTSYESLKPWVKNGLFVSSGPKWFHDRKLIGPTFHFSILERFIDIFSEKSKILTKMLERELEKNPEKPINVFPFSVNVSLDVICEAAMGVNIHAQESDSKYALLSKKVLEMAIQRFLRPWYTSDLLYFLTPTGKENKAVLNGLHEFSESVIRKRKIERSKTDYANLNNTDNDNTIKRKKVFLDVLLDQNEKDDTPLTDDEVRSQVDTFMFAGHDTTAVTITWTLFCLSNSSEHQEKVHEELDKVFKDPDAPITMKELSQLKYLDRVIKESLRLYPSVPIISRKLVEDLQLGDYVVPKDTIVDIPIVLVHRNPEIWPDPLKFDPDRFLPENSKNRSQYAYIPFSAGLRNCIGQKFALLELKVVLSSILRKWRVKSVKTHITYKWCITYHPDEEVLIHFTPKTN
ncbi:cytochrome P450 4C1-like isoform X2 [Pseudomyrmex gracilis]|nr:cytochrome P450 4C1-like isoform X2 [Pseudomyrmex gracilis]XP_020284913.1 cytochrome P450 4C1-like isoform X2 [Pseudomyrmex gracilis]